MNKKNPLELPEDEFLEFMLDLCQLRRGDIGFEYDLPNPRYPGAADDERFWAFMASNLQTRIQKKTKVTSLI